MKLTSFIYPGCIIVCDTDEETISGNYPEIARIFHDRSIQWKRKRITEQMRTYVENVAKEPFIAISDTQQINFFH